MKKRLICFLLTTLLLTALLPLMVVTAFADENTVTDSQGVIYTLNTQTNTATVSGHTNALPASVLIPDTIEIGEKSYPVTEIEKKAFFLNDTLISVNLGSVTSIGECAFMWCYYLEEVTLPERDVSIGNSAFLECDSLSTINLDHVTSIGESAFRECGSLSTINLHHVTSIGKSAFQSCGLTSANLESLTSIGECAFMWCHYLKEVTLPERELSIVNSAFQECSSLTTINLDHVTSIGESAFRECGLTSANLGSVTSIGERAFLWCHYLEEVTLPERDVSIGNSAFQECGSLTTINLDHVTSIGEYAFQSCGMTSVNLESLTSIGGSAFMWCYFLTEVTLPERYISLEDATFWGCGSLTTINLDHVTSIGKDTFQSCGMTSANLKSVTSIGECAFLWCYFLEEVTFGKTVPTGLNEGVFPECPLSRIYVPAEKAADYQAVLGRFADKVTKSDTALATVISLGSQWLILVIVVLAIGCIVMLIVKKRRTATDTK